MRKLFSLLLMLTLLLSSALAVEGMPYDESTVVSVLNLNEAQRNLADFLYPEVMAHKARIDLPRDTRYNDVEIAMNCLMQDYPELFHLDHQYSIGYYTSEPDVATYVEPTYRMNEQAARQWRNQLCKEAGAIVSQGLNAWQLHDMLCARVVYGGDQLTCHSALGSLIVGQATCEGYAQGLTLLYRMAGIPCGIVTGDAVASDGSVERHAWNIADVNGLTLIDATWNDQDRQNYVTHWYFGLSSDQLSVSHRPDDNQTVPHCTDNGSWHRYHGLYITTMEEAFAAVRDIAQSGGTISLRVADAQVYWRMAHETDMFLDQYNDQAAEDERFYGTYSWMFEDRQMCLMLRFTAE